MSKSPCKDCKDRELGCHAKCDKYIAFKMDSEKEKEERRVYIENHYNTMQKRKNIRR